MSCTLKKWHNMYAHQSPIPTPFCVLHSRFNSVEVIIDDITEVNYIEGRWFSSPSIPQNRHCDVQ